MLAALVAMAIRSRRYEADYDIALRRAGIAIDKSTREEMLLRLQELGWITRLVYLGDGGIIAVVTSAGFDRLRATGFEYLLRTTDGR